MEPGNPYGTVPRSSVCGTIPEFTLISDYVASGGGYGDPLDRDPEHVRRDVEISAASREAAGRIYGVVLRPGVCSVDETATRAQREAIRKARLQEGEPVTPLPDSSDGREHWRHVNRIHEYLEIVGKGVEKRVRCLRCGYFFCNPKQNYKKHCLKRIVELEEIATQPPPTHEPYQGRYHEYICPGCATLLHVDVYCPELGGDEDLWDIQLS